jgi:hypothetical protein
MNQALNAHMNNKRKMKEKKIQFIYATIKKKHQKTPLNLWGEDDGGPGPDDVDCSYGRPAQHI